MYIKKLPKVDKTCETYGKAGNCVHEHLDNYASNKKSDFVNLWKLKQLNTMPGFGGDSLSLPSYKKCVERGQNIIDLYKNLGFQLTTEEVYSYEYDSDVTIKGIMDLKAIRNDEIRILDWKTDSSTELEKHLKQQLFYALLFYKKHQVLPDIMSWHYLKFDGKKDSYIPKLIDVLNFEKYLHKIIEEIKLKGDNPDNYELGNINSPFNSYKSLLLVKPNSLKIEIREGKTILSIH